VTLELADPADPLVRAQGADIGFHTTAVDGLQSTVSAYWLELDSELVFFGDAATTELGPPSRRLGVEIANIYRVRPWLSLDLDLTLTDSEFTDVPDEESEIPARWVAPCRLASRLAGRRAGSGRCAGVTLETFH
jgi:hypothetical protein